MPDLQTKRLTLMRFTRQLMLASMEGRERLSAATGLAVAPDWPNPEMREALPYFAGKIAATPEFERWCYLLVESESRTIVGDAGFLDAPKDGSVEIGFGVCPSRRRRGYAAEAVAALTEWAIRQPGVNCVRARTDPANPGAGRCVEKAGFIRRSAHDGMIEWQRVQ